MSQIDEKAFLVEAPSLSRITERTRQFLFPSFYSASRQGSASTSTFNLVSTIIGGAVLSLPWTIAKAGLIPGLLLIVMWAFLADFSIYLLLMCSRHCGNAHTYEMVAERAFGPYMKVAVVVQVFLICLMASIGYTVLAGTLTLQLIQAFHDFEPCAYQKYLAYLAINILCLPGCFSSSMKNLRLTSLLSILAMFLLCFVLGLRSITLLARNGSPFKIVLWPTSFENLLYTMPLYSSAYLCHFNVLPMHIELEKPTRKRMLSVLHTTMLCCFLIYASVAVLGYIHEREETCDMIFSNFCPDDVAIIIGRIALILVLCCSYPLLIHPARHSLNRLLEFRSILHPSIQENELITTENQPDQTDDANSVAPTVLRYRIIFVLKTLSIMGSALVIACLVPSVHVVWSILGSTVCLIVGFIFPALFYLKLRVNEYKIWNIRMICALLLLIFCVICSIVATIISFKNINSQGCPAGYKPKC